MVTFRRLVFLVLCVFFVNAISAAERDSVLVHFNLKFGNAVFETGNQYISKNRDTLKVNVFKCYISAITLQYGDGSIVTSNKKFHLLDIENPESLKLMVDGNSNKQVTNMTFNVGIDSTASVSGALSGDLDPSKGMYWAWQSGYINFKIEGNSSSCKTRKNEFQFHIGGYIRPNYALREVKLNLSQASPQITVDLGELFSKIKLAESNTIMIPGQKAMAIADHFATIFRIE